MALNSFYLLGVNLNLLNMLLNSNAGIFKSMEQLFLFVFYAEQLKISRSFLITLFWLNFTDFEFKIFFAIEGMVTSLNELLTNKAVIVSPVYVIVFQ